MTVPVKLSKSISPHPQTPVESVFSPAQITELVKAKQADLNQPLEWTQYVGDYIRERTPPSKVNLGNFALTTKFLELLCKLWIQQSVTQLSLSGTEIVLIKKVPNEIMKKHWMGLEKTNMVTEMISATTHLLVLDLTATQMNDKGLWILAKGIKNNKGMHTLILQNNDFTPKWVEHLWQIIEFGKLEKIDVSENNIFNKESMIDFGHCLSNECISLKNLQIKSWSIKQQDISTFYFSLEENKSIETLNLSNNNLKGPDPIEWENLLSDNETIKSLTLSNWNLWSQSVWTIINCLNKNKSVVSLNLKANNLTNQHGYAILMLLNNKKRPQFKYLNLAENMLTTNIGQRIVDVVNSFTAYPCKIKLEDNLIMSDKQDMLKLFSSHNKDHPLFDKLKFQDFMHKREIEYNNLVKEKKDYLEDNNTFDKVSKELATSYTAIDVQKNINNRKAYINELKIAKETQVKWLYSALENPEATRWGHSTVE